MLLKIVAPAAVIAVGLLSGCAKEPVNEVAAARDAVKQALEADGSSYAGETTAEAGDLLADLETELETQNHRWGPLRSYARVESLATAAATVGMKAADEARAAEAAAREEAASTLSQVRDELKNALTELASAPPGKGGEVDLEAMRLDLVDMGNQLNEIEGRYREVEYAQVAAQATAILGSITEVREAIAEAVRRTTPAPAQGTRG